MEFGDAKTGKVKTRRSFNVSIK